MFNNIGGKIKGVAVVVCWIGIVASVIMGIWFIAEGDEEVGIPILLAGPLFSWLGSLGFYGFGQLIENSDIQAQNSVIQTELMRQEKADNRKKAEPTPAPVRSYAPQSRTPVRNSVNVPSSVNAPKTEPLSNRNSTATTVQVDDKHKRCQACRTIQSLERTTCLNCGATFVES